MVMRVKRKLAVIIVQTTLSAFLCSSVSQFVYFIFFDMLPTDIGHAENSLN